MYKVLLLILPSLIIFMAACSTPEEKAHEYYKNGQALLEAGEPVKAKLEFQNALQIDEKMIAAWYGLALVAEKSGKWQESFGFLNKVLELDSKHLQALIKSGRLLLAAGELERALEVSNKAMELAPKDASVLALHAAVFYKLEDSKSALKFANAALAIDPGNIDAIAVLATERLAANDATGALEYLNQAERDVGLQLIKIDALSRLDQLEAVEEVYWELIESYPDTGVFRLKLADFYIEHDRQADAEQIYRDVMLANPDDITAKLDLVRFVNAIYGLDVAVDEVEKFIDAEPGNMELLFILSQLNESAGKLEQAKSTLALIIAQAKSADERLRAMGQLATIQAQQGQESEAMALVDSILEQDPRNEQALLLKTTRLIDEGKFDEAISNLRTILKDTPDSARALFMLGSAHELSGSIELADDLYDRAFQASGQSPEYGVPYAAFLQRIQRVERASEVLEDTLRVQPNNLEALTVLAQIRIDHGDWAGAQSVADRIAALENTETVSQQILGAVHAGKKDYEQSIDAFKLAYRASPAESRPMVSLVQAFVRAGKQEEAIDFLKTVLAENDTNENAMLLLAQVYASKNEDEKAIGIFLEVIEHNPGNINAYQNLAMIELRAGDHVGALEILDNGLTKNPGDPSLLFTKAGIYENQQNFHAAIGVYEELLKEHPAAVVIVNNLASLLTDHGEDEASLKRAHELALRFTGSNIPHFQDTLGWTYFRMGDFEQAEELIETATKRLPNVPVFRYHLGMVYAAQDRADLARSEFETALQLAGDDPFVFRESAEQAIKEL